MKAKIIIPLFIIVSVFLVRLSVVKDKVEDYEIVYEEVKRLSHNVYYYDGEKLVSVSYTFDNTIEVNYLFDLLTNKSNSIKEDYDTKLIITTRLLSYEIKDNNIILNVDNEFTRYNEVECYQIYSQLKNTFSNLGYESLIINVNDILLENIGYIDISCGIVLTNI